MDRNTLRPGLRMVVNSQTPLLRLRGQEAPKPTTGGVTRMLEPLLHAWIKDGTVADAEWVSLSTSEQAPILERDGFRLSFVPLDEEELRGYAAVKERLWGLLNSTASSPAPRGARGIPEEAWLAFESYQRRSARALEEASERMGGVDVAYIHDFQQLGVASAWRSRVPKVFHLHTPFPRAIPPAWRDYVVGEMERYDAVVVSTRRYADNLRSVGLTTPVHVVRPFIDPAAQGAPPRRVVDALRARLHLRDEDEVILNVGRMDPMKGQDRLIRAMPAILERDGDARLVLVGNGSFSSAKRGGLGLSKGEQWRAALEALAADLGVSQRVTFAGHLSDEEVAAAYELASVFCLPSTREGFGLAAIEAWRHRKPVVANDWAGVAELVQDGVNGYALDCSDEKRLADALANILAAPDLAAKMGEAGRRTSEEATLPQGRRALERVIAALVEGIAVEAA